MIAFPSGAEILGALVMIMLLVIQAVFVILKLTGQINWSWWWTLSPFVIPMASFLAFVIVTMALFWIIFGIGKLFGYKFED
jgi:hypothetical protein